MQSGGRGRTFEIGEPNMNAKKSSFYGVPLITIHGDIDHASVRGLAPLMLDCLAPQEGRIVFDLADCPYLDSSGIGLFLGLLFDTAETVRIAVVGANAALSRVFQLTGLSSQGNFRLWTDRSELRRALRAEDKAEPRVRRSLLPAEPVLSARPKTAPPFRATLAFS
jgi:anti-sigma B factor antagonist